jgi:hypothetical protein
MSCAWPKWHMSHPVTGCIIRNRAEYNTVVFVGNKGNCNMERELIDRAEAIQERILQLRDSL